MKNEENKSNCWLQRCHHRCHCSQQINLVMQMLGWFCFFFSLCFTSWLSRLGDENCCGGSNFVCSKSKLGRRFFCSIYESKALSFGDDESLMSRRNLICSNSEFADTDRRLFSVLTRWCGNVCDGEIKPYVRWNVKSANYTNNKQKGKKRKKRKKTKTNRNEPKKIPLKLNR